MLYEVITVADKGKFGVEVDQLQQLMQKALGRSLSTEKGENSIEVLQSDTFSAPVITSYSIHYTKLYDPG